MAAGDAVGRRERVPQSRAGGGPRDAADGKRERVPQSTAGVREQMVPGEDWVRVAPARHTLATPVIGERAKRVEGPSRGLRASMEPLPSARAGAAPSPGAHQRAAALGSAVRRDRARSCAGQRRLGEQRKPLRHHFPEKRLRLKAFRYVLAKRPAPPKSPLSSRKDAQLAHGNLRRKKSDGDCSPPMGGPAFWPLACPVGRL